MIFRTRVPAPPLSRFVEMLWYFSGPGPTHRKERVLPDGSAELVVNLDNVPRKRFDRSRPHRFETVRHAWISGPQPEFILIDVLPLATMVGVHFKPGGLVPFIDMPAGELAGQLIELESLWGRTAHDLRDALLETPGIEPKLHSLESFLRRRLQRFSSPESANPAVRRFLEHPAGMPIETVARQLGLSHKHFIHRFRAEVGLSPKRFCRIQRFQQTLARLQSAPPTLDWAEVACAAGYYDQAHLIHDFKKFSGLTPGGYLRQPGADTRFVPITD